MAVSTLASLAERETTPAPRVEEPSSKLPSSSSGDNPMISSSTAKSYKDPKLDRNEEEVSESPGRASVSRIDLLMDINALFSGTYVKDSSKDAKKSEREILCELMDSFDLPFHRPRPDGAHDSGPSRIGGSATSQSRTTNPDYSHQLAQHTNMPVSHSNRSPSSAAVSQPSSESKESGHAFQHLGKKTHPNTLTTYVPINTSNSNSTALDSSINSTISKPSSSSHANPSKGPLRLSSKNFATKSLNQGAALPISDRTGNGVAGGEVGLKWMIVHGKVVPMKTDTHAYPSRKKVDSGPVGAVSQSLSRAEMIRIYCQKNCINPFKLKEAESYLRSLTPNRRRWSHVSPAGFLVQMKLLFIYYLMTFE